MRSELDWFVAAKAMLQATTDENEDAFKKAIQQLHEIVSDYEDALTPGTRIEDLLAAHTVVTRCLLGTAVPPSVIKHLCVDVAHFALASFKKGELLWKEPAHRKMEDMRELMLMQVAVDKADLVQSLRELPSMIGDIPTQQALVELFNQPPATAEQPIIHWMRAGVTFCPMTFVFHIAAQWPKHHQWVSLEEDLAKVTCVVCKKIAP